MDKLSKLFLDKKIIRIKSKVNSSELTTFKLGAGVSQVYEPQNLFSLLELVKDFKDYKVIGNGSNIVLPDSVINTPVIRLPKEFSIHFNVERFPDELLGGNIEIKEGDNLEVKEEEIKILAFGSCSLMKLSSFFSNYGFSGLEFAAGIPASVAGATFMNAGAHGNEISEVIDCVYLVNNENNCVKLEKKHLVFNYRNSNIEGLIVAVGLRLKRKDKIETIKKRKDSLAYRKETQPLTLPSAGSVFKNFNDTNTNKVTYAAELIESLGLKGHRLGGLEFSKLHSNWLVKIDEKAKTEDFISLVQLAKDKVEKKYSLKLNTEIKLWQ